MAILFEQVQDLYNNHLYEDVIYLASISVTYSDKNSELFTMSSRFQIFYYQGMSYYNVGDYAMAEQSFNAALSIGKVHKLKGKKGMELASETVVRFALYKCYNMMNNPSSALTTLETIPLNQRTAEMHVAYIKLLSINKSIKENKSIIIACKEIIKINPMSIFALKTLVQCGEKFEEINHLLKSSLSNFSTIEWFSQIILSFQNIETCEYELAIDSYSRLVSDPLCLFGNITIFTSIAEAYYLKGDYQRCITTFKQINGIDRKYTNKMGIYAFVLHRESQIAEIKKLASQMMLCCKQSADVWVVLGFHQLILSKYTQAFAFAQKALSIDPNNVEACLLKGLSAIELKGEVFDSVVLYFREATRIAPNHFEPYKCIVDYYLQMEYISLATTAACEIHKLKPCARSNALYASILIKDTANADQAKSLLENIIIKDCECLDAVLLLARLYRSQGNINDALNVLEKHPPHYTSFKYHQLMADILLMSKDKLKALDHQVLAMKLDPRTPKVLNFESSVEPLDDNEWYSGSSSSIPSRILFREGVLAESPGYEQDHILDP